MAVGSGNLPELHNVEGFRLGIGSAGIKTPGRRDLVVMEICAGAAVAGVFTKNAFCAAPVQVAKRHIAAQTPRYLLVNTGNANAGTGEQGLLDSEQCCALLAEQAEVSAEQVLPFSTGVIGELLAVDKIAAAIPQAIADLKPDNWVLAAEGIMTTDTRPKAASRQFDFDGQTVTVTGIAKGAGMIKPNMATMLGYIATDAAVDQALLNDMVLEASNQSFNRITIDGDTSTNDACILVATGKTALAKVTSKTDALYQPLYDAICSVFIELAQGLVRDGEGASKFVTVKVLGGKTEQETLDVAFTVAESPLVKTALFASDPNWGRLLAAIGRAGVPELDVSLVSVSLNEVLIAERGCRAASYTEEQGQAVMDQEEITITIDLARGEQQSTVWTTDLSYDYVRINADYRS
ncbi:bifunctional glutamate N-acetyltransferase/amino-acid acetyltransferase ArgJ [Dasania sp. GY-MA-18]|uniref:Arginine biosynthesis bifunctional protein ArgJ n=1 Tax=Dasania phycosphaerae TaxID=2950436 RepID=A0A9J6RP79_9GAMM|nr:MULTISPECIES: bifunctional glutamate N-acetyltransferase/amino-acid acetyltransferase ArgJ [Dasania]MCR8923679.1 bifunctional glutamate N-acetyltransferase/amino-acid acetyltransferase ArgJ [Dasania sp. GY-MA-18]MCZ0866113.1 bifunctional glutamate N-acetyltransferase/amino-acid acetyltransferase ArgJ [Dasania phycosphaerae]MCZ0869837.1 bifunctional glutamate N-acetyltransferase/amino-acid acetyltransferase ArgJ [Dasania phycosphaerae]